MTLVYLVAALAAAIVAVFALQNGAPVTVRFLVWTVDAVPLAGVVLIALAGGLIVAGLPLLFRGWHWRAPAPAPAPRGGALRENGHARPPATPPPPPPPQRDLIPTYSTQPSHLVP